MANTANTIPDDTEWTPADRDAAQAEGWDIFDCSGSENGRAQLCRIDEDEKFDGDPATWAHVVSKANDGSELHRKALDVIGKHNPGERNCIAARCEEN